MFLWCYVRLKFFYWKLVFVSLHDTREFNKSVGWHRDGTTNYIFIFFPWSTIFQTTGVKIWTDFIVYFQSYRRYNRTSFALSIRMEKNEFRGLIKQCFPMGKKSYIWNNGFIYVKGNLLYQSKLLRSGLVNLNEILQAEKMLNDQEGQKTLPLQKSSKNSWHRTRWSKSKNAWVSWGRRHINWVNGSNFA